jgi:orotate phosphoribosyltransferase
MLSSGKYSNIYYDFRKLKEFDNSLDKQLIKGILVGLSTLKDYLYKKIDIVGIKTIGHYLTKDFDNSIWFDPKTLEFEGKISRIYIVFDDVFTTGNTIRKCILSVGYKPKFIVVIVKRNDFHNKDTFMDIPIIEIRKLLELNTER